jgi:hemolysin activation/secretion protein
MRLTATLLTTCAAMLPQLAHAQNGADAAATLGRDVVSPQVQAGRETTITPRADVGAAAGVQAQAAPGGIYIRGVNVAGTQQIGGNAFETATGKFVGQTLSQEGLQQLARSVADEARARGYIFASAMIPEQEIRMGVIRVQLDEGRVDEVRINGSNSRRLRRILNGIVSPSALKSVIERQLLLAEDLPGIEIADSQYVREGNRGILIITVKEDHASGSANLDNSGSKAFGPIRARVEMNLTSLITDGDELAVRVIATPISPRELAYVSASYSTPIGDDGARIGITGGAGRTQPSDIPDGALIGRSRSASVFGSYPVVRGNNASLWVNAEIAYLNVDTKIIGLLLQRDDVVTMSISANGNMRVAGGRLSGGIGYVRGLSILGATSAGDVFASRPDGSGQFNKFTGWFSWSGPIGGNFSLRLTANGQVATSPLLSSQEIGFGGPGFGRGFDFSERYGDGGVAGVAELQYNLRNPIRRVDWAQLYGFVDGGYIYNLRGGFGSGSLMSAGGGVRAGAGPIEFGLEAAVPVVGTRAEGARKPRVNFSLGYNF